MRASQGNPGRTYKFYTGEPVYAFGTGLSYTTFSYETIDRVQPTYNIADLAVSALVDDPQLKDIALTIKITNTGSVQSDVVVLAFVNSTVSPAGVTPPIKELFDYARIHQLMPGMSETITFGLSYRVLGHVDMDGHTWLLPGKYEVRIQNEQVLVHEFELVGEALLIEEMPQPSTNTAATAATTEQPVKAHRHSHRGAF